MPFTLTDRWIDRSVVADKQGRFVFDGLPAFEANVRIDAPNRAPAFRVIDPGRTSATEIRLNETGRLELTVVDASGNPITEGSFSIRPDVPSTYDRDHDKLRDAYLLASKATSAFSRAPGRYVISVYHPPTKQSGRTTAEVRSGETMTVELRLTAP